MMNKIIVEQVTASLLEDIGEGDITAALLPANSTATATVITRQDMLVCGLSWFDEVYRQLDKNIKIKHFVQEGDWVKANTRLIELSGLTRSLLTGERSALNWLQTLSATATVTRQYLSTLENTKTKLLDTRKTLPGFRYAQKYAVKVAGGHNHRMGLFDAYLIKENHIVACGSIAAAIERAVELNPDKLVEIEVENLAEFNEALAAKADIIMLDNFDLDVMQQAVVLCAGRAKLEASGNVSLENIADIAATGVDYISVGALTKNINAIDLSMRVITTSS